MPKRPKPAEINVAVAADGRYAIDGVQQSYRDAASLANALRTAAGDRKDPVIVISADAQTTHQSVINVMEAARQAQISQITFATQTSPGK